MEFYYFKCSCCGKGVSVLEQNANEEDLCEDCQKLKGTGNHNENE